MPSSAPAPSETSPLSLHDALPILLLPRQVPDVPADAVHRRETPLRLCGRDAINAPAKLTAREPQLFDQRVHDANDLLAHVPLYSGRSEEHTSELQSHHDLVCRLLLLRPPRPPLFPYTTLFRSCSCHARCPMFQLMQFIGVRRRCASAGETPSTPRRNSLRANRSCSTSGCTMPTTSSLTSLCTRADRKSTRLNSSHITISYAVFCSCALRDLPSFPTRRSSDLAPATPGARCSS